MTNATARHDDIAATIGSLESPKLVCRAHVEGTPVLGWFTQDDLEPDEKCQVAGCGKTLGIEIN